MYSVIQPQQQHGWIGPVITKYLSSKEGSWREAGWNWRIHLKENVDGNPHDSRRKKRLFCLKPPGSRKGKGKARAQNPHLAEPFFHDTLRQLQPPTAFPCLPRRH
ncbi:hypothetical protein VTJ04DRAFT_3608 [Mycothermus thermophilus]|uniref:uncharacterized protein n=1 Tax=Humicola insolens TaxID=85995 RepID=UPI0037428FE3